MFVKLYQLLKTEITNIYNKRVLMTYISLKSSKFVEAVITSKSSTI